MPDIDLYILTRGTGPLRPEVLQGLAGQVGVRCSLYRLVGRPKKDDANRYETIARARNLARTLGTSPWAMFLDDDVVLEPTCIERLLSGLQQRSSWGALAADYLGQRHGSTVGHVAMGATLFRRDVLRTIRFRWEDGKCECRCCCEDLGRRGIRIGYLPTARARHLTGLRQPMGTVDSEPNVPLPGAPRILVALDWCHFERFCGIFLRTLQATGNRVPVSVVGYGLGRAEQQQLSRHTNVEHVLSNPASASSPAIRRVKDFQHLLEKQVVAGPVAYWDAGDVMFQTRLDDLWRIVGSHPNKILAVREPASHPRNPALQTWTCRIPNLETRTGLFRFLFDKPFLNSGFAAGSAEAVLHYLRFAENFLRDSNIMHEPPADQLAFNFFCHSQPDRWHEADEGWNYCLAYRRDGRLQQRRRGDKDWCPELAALPRIVTPNGATVHVVHGNGHTLEATLKNWWAARRYA